MVSVQILDEEEILADLNRIAQELGLINEVFEASHIYIYYSVFARVFGRIIRVFSTYIDNIDINETTDEALLERLIAPWVTKRSASTAKVILTFTRRNFDSESASDIFIPRNFEVMTEMTDNPIVFRTAEARILWRDTYSVKVPAYSIDLGAINNVNANTLTYFVDSEFANISVTNEAPAYGGSDEETSYDSRQRILSFRYAREGAKAQLQSVLSSAGIDVESFRITEFYNGYGSLLIALECDSDSMFQDVINRIEVSRPQGILYNYCRVEPQYMNFDIKVYVTGSRIYDEYSIDAIFSSIKTAVELYFSQDVWVGMPLSLKRLQAFVLNYIVSENYEIYEIDMSIENEDKYEHDRTTKQVIVKPWQKLYANKLTIDIDYEDEG